MNSRLLICLILGSALTLSSCGKLGNRRVGKFLPKGTIAGLSEPAVGNLSKSELPIALRICGALSTKRQFINTTLGSETPKRLAYNFSFETKDCQNKTTETKNISAEILTQGTDLVYNSADTKNHFEDVITEKSLGLVEICKQVVLAGPALDLKVITNVSGVGNKIYITKFSTDSLGFDTVQINTKIANATNGFDPFDAQVISLYTAVTQVTQVRDVGVEKSRGQFIPCTGSEFKSRTETFQRSVFL